MIEILLFYLHIKHILSVLSYLFARFQELRQVTPSENEDEEELGDEEEEEGVDYEQTAATAQAQGARH